MTVVNNLAITDNLVKTLQSDFGTYFEGEDSGLDFVSYMLEINDHLLCMLTETQPDDMKEIARISNLLVNAKALRDSLTHLKADLNECTQLTNN